MAGTATCDSPDLWGQIRSAKNSFSKNGFSRTYGTPPRSPTDAAGKNALEDKVGESSPAVESPQQKPSSVKTENTRDKTAETPTERVTPSAMENLLAMAPHIHSEQVPVPPPSAPPPRSSGFARNPKTRPQPCTPPTYTEIPTRKAREPRHPGKNQSNKPAVCIDIPRTQHIPHTPQIRSPLAQGVPSSSATNKSSKAVGTVNSAGTAQKTTMKTAGSDDADEVLPYKRRGNNGRFRHGSRNSKGLRRNRSPNNNPNPAQQFMKQTAPHNVDGRRVSQVSGWTEGLHKGVRLPLDHQLEGSTPSPSPSDIERNRSAQAEDPMMELARLQREALLNAHRNVGHDPMASPEMLARCRDGPGTDHTSKVYQDIAEMRTVPQDHITDTDYYLESSEIFSTDMREDVAPEFLERELNSRLKLYRELYKKSATAYPTNGVRNESGDGERLILSPTPTTKHKRILSKIREGRRELAPEPTKPFDGKKAGSNEIVQIYKNSWTDPAIVDWEYCPRCIADGIPYRARFQSWLESTLKCECAVDIFHEAFFNGTAHADGETSTMFMLCMNYETLLDPADKASGIHAHETAAGYCLNVSRQNQIADEAQEHRKKIEHEIRVQARRQPLRSPSSPVANVYLRPVDDRDVPSLKEIYDWYARNSVESPNTHALDEDAVRQRIQECDNSNLSFIVAIDRRSASSRSEKVLGYACAREFDKHEASRFTAELEVFVRDEHTSLGIGRCLLDKLVELCDPTYRPKSDFEFLHPSGDKSGYLPGGRRRLARLVITLGYVDGKEISKHKRVKQWLRACADFEEQGVLRGVRERNGDLINVVYLVRRAGHSPSSRLES